MSADGKAGPAEVLPLQRLRRVGLQRLRRYGIEGRPRPADGAVRDDHLSDVQRLQDGDVPELPRLGIGPVLHRLAVALTAPGWLDLHDRWHPTLRQAVVADFRTLVAILRADPNCPICSGINSQNCSRCRG